MGNKKHFSVVWAARLRVAWARIRAAALLFLALAPLMALISVSLLNGDMTAALVCLLLSLGLGILPSFFSPKKRIPLLVAAMFFAGCLIAKRVWPFGYQGLVLLLPCLFSMPLLLTALVKPRGGEWSTGWLIVGIALNVCCRLVAGWLDYAQLDGPLNLMFAIYLVPALFRINENSVRRGSANRPISQKVRRGNKLLTLGMSAFVLAISNWGWLLNCFENFIQIIKQGLSAFFQFLLNLFTPANVAGSDTDMGLMTPDDYIGTEVTQGNQLERIILAILVFLALSALLIFLGPKIIRFLRRLFQKLRALLRQYAEAAETEYTDSISRIPFSEQSDDEEKQKPRPRRQPFSAWEKLSPREKVRQAYRMLITSRKDFDESLTAREALTGGQFSVDAQNASKMSALYEAARYSDHDIAALDAEWMRSAAKPHDSERRTR